MIRLHTSSTGLDPAALVPGRDLVMALHPVHGTAAADGTYVLDHLDPAGRAAADRAAVAAHDAWRAGLAGEAAAAGIDWPFIWMLPVHSILNGAVARALALRSALRTYAVAAVELADTDGGTAALARAVADEVVAASSARAPQPPLTIPPPVSRARRLRRRALDEVTRLGLPSGLRRGSVAFHAYWPLAPLLERMVAEPGRRPAVFMEKRPTGVGRTLATASQGGWIGLPTPLDRARARADAARVVAAVRAHDSVVADGLQLGAWLHPRLVALAQARAVEDLASAAMLRRAFRGRRAAWVVGCYDVAPNARLIVTVAQEAGVRTLMLGHGAFLLPQPFGDLDVCDEVALWTRAVAPAITNWDRPIHEVGYPLAHDASVRVRPAPSHRPTIAVLGQLPVTTTCVLDERITMRTYEVALEAIARRFPDARVLLRPHPSQDRAASPAVIARFPALDVQERGGGDIVEFMRGVDLCIGSASTATLQAPLGGAAVIALNLSGTEWPYPIGGADTSVPIARSAVELDAALERWASGGVPPGAGDLLGALGAGRGDATAKLLAVLDRRATAEAVAVSAR